MYEYVLVIPTYNAGEQWKCCLEAVKNQSVLPKNILIVDSSSDDNTIGLAKKYDSIVLQINKKDFGHGLTRQYALSQVKDVDVVVYCTQDALLSDANCISRILDVFVDASVGAVYGRQMPRKTANLLEIHERQFSYTSQSHIYSYDARKNFGMKTCFLSNAFTAYRLEALQQVGGFPSNTIVSEDMYVGAKMLMAGWKLGYCADASVIHSHSYHLRELFGRYFDIGVFNARERWIREEFGSAENEGLRYLKSEIRFLWDKNPLLVPYALIRTAVKYAGFKLGLIERYLPRALKKWVSRQKQFWDKD